MPFKSPQQEAYLRAHHPEIYRRWKKKYGPYKGALADAVKAAGGKRGRRS